MQAYIACAAFDPRSREIVERHGTKNGHSVLFVKKYKIFHINSADSLYDSQFLI